MSRHELGAAERRARMIGWRSGDVLRATALVTSYLLVLALVWTAREIVFTAFLGVLFGLAVGDGADRLTRLRIPRGIGAPLVVIAFLGALFGDFAQELQRQMSRFCGHPSRRRRYGPQFTLNFSKTCANSFRKFDANKKSH